MPNNPDKPSYSTSQSTHNTTKENLSDELLFLIACCQSEPNDDDIDLIQTTLSTINHQPLTTIATRHGILPLVYKTLKNLYSKNGLITIDYRLSTEILPAFKQQYLAISRRNMLMTSELIRIMNLLRENGIEALAFKGPALAQMAYGDITLRQYVDLDVLVKKEDIYKIDSLLKARGYERVIKLTENQERLWLLLKHDLGLYHPKNGIHFEMHWSLMDEDYPVQMKQSNLWNNAQTVKINGREINTFPTEDLLLYLCIHGSTHLWERIEWIKDVDLLVRTQNMKWDDIIKEAKNANVETIFSLGMYLASQLFKTPLPSTILEHISNDKKLITLSHYIFQSWIQGKTGSMSLSLQRTKAMLMLFPDTKARLSYLHKIMLKPTLNEYDLVDLPRTMYWAYYFVRPYVLLKKYLSKS